MLDWAWRIGPSGSLVYCIWPDNEVFGYLFCLKGFEFLIYLFLLGLVLHWISLLYCILFSFGCLLGGCSEVVGKLRNGGKWGSWYCRRLCYFPVTAISGSLVIPRVYLMSCWAVGRWVDLCLLIQMPWRLTCVLFLCSISFHHQGKDSDPRLRSFTTWKQEASARIIKSQKLIPKLQ